MRRVRLESLGVSLPRRRLVGNGSLAHALRAGRACLAASRYAPADVDLLVNCGVHRDGHVCEPAIACYIQDGLGINPEFRGHDTLSFDLLAGGVGPLVAMQVVAAQLLAGDIAAGMVVMSEANSDRRPDPGYPYPPSGAAALLDVSPQKDVGFGPFAFHTDERHAGLFTSVVALDRPRGRLLLRRAPGLEDAYLAGAVPAAREALERDGLAPGEVDLVVPAQVSPALIARLQGALGVPAGRVLDLTAELPDTHTTSVLLALARARAPGKRLLLLAFGSGVTVGAVVYRS